MKKVFAPHLGREVRLGGRKIPKVFHTTLKMSHFLQLSDLVPAPPPSMDLTKTSLAAQRNIDLNDTLGDCVIAGRAHRIALATGAAGNTFAYSKDQILKEYERVGGYVPGDASTDQGCDMTTAAEDAVKVGYADGSKDVGYVSVDAGNPNEVKAAFFVLENGDLGLALPDAWINPFPSTDGFVWDVAGAPDPENGHCVQIVGYNTSGVLINSWGLFGTITWAALKKYGTASGQGELLVHANADVIAKATSMTPAGIDWTTLITFFDQTLGGTAPIPVGPAPTPPPPAPSPNGTVTLAQAQHAVDTALHNNGILQTRTAASKVAQAALAKLTGWAT
jgi:hypothetical protein